ncbi:MAG: AtpZ/AtpI family protein [Bacteroidota bacterium]|jgi:F0F1-type ATP synthase assembly protein I|nr:AtpZ/AtpI family protein [Bacteroidota bacterium]
MKLGDFNSLAKAYREAMPYLTIGIQMAAIVVILFFVGKWADEKLSTSPWLLLLGIFLGIGSSFYHFFKTIVEINKKSSNKNHQK